jgi:hypothetical protein
MNTEKQKRLEERVHQAMDRALAQKGYVCAIDILLGTGWLSEGLLKDWRNGRVDYLERVIQANLSKITSAMMFFRGASQDRGLNASETVYLMKTSGPKRELRFSKSGEPSIEKAYRTHYVSPELSEKKLSKITKELNQPPELTVFQVRRDSKCVQCGTEILRGSLLLLEQERPLCMTCSGFKGFIYLPAGNAKLSRLAKKLSGRYAVVVEFIRSRRRYERQGLLVEKAAFDEAKIACMKAGQNNDRSFDLSNMVI